LRSSSIEPNFDTGGSKFGRNFDQTSTPQCRNFDQTSTKLRPNFDQTSTPPVSNFGRSLLDTSMKYIVSLIECLPNCDTKLRPNFDTGGSKFDRNFDQTSTHQSKFALGERREGKEGRGDEETKVCTQGISQYSR